MVLIKSQRDTLLAPLQAVSGIVERRHTLPILSNVLLEKKGDRLTLLATDIEIQAREILRMREITNQLLAKHTGQPLERIIKDTDRDYFMGAGEAKEYGLIDDVIVHKKATEKKLAFLVDFQSRANEFYKGAVQWVHDGHIGKVVLALDHRNLAVARPGSEPTAFRPDASYLITGGLGGFGLTVARWMVECGARRRRIA